MCAEVKSMKKNFGKNAETNVQEVREQNRQSQLGKSQNAEFASETNVAEVKEQNRQAEMKKQQANGANGSSNQSK